MPLRTPVMAGNWKMNKGPTETAAFFAEFLAAWPARPDRTVAFFPPAVSLAAAVAATEGRGDILLGVQNVHWQAGGAFTGELSVAMAADAGARLVLVGHSERRHVFGETDAETEKKVRAVFHGGLTPVLCVGELIEERRAGHAETVVRRQLAAVLPSLSADEARRLVVAYEPVWAIGTGETASPADAGAMHRVCREALAQAFGAEVAAAVPVLYGGSVKPDNAAELLAEPGVDGVLVGGASLDAKGFAAICGAGPG
jgi:triosephosphate isomerase